MTRTQRGGGECFLGGSCFQILWPRRSSGKVKVAGKNWVGEWVRREWVNDEPKAQLTLTLTELPSTPTLPYSLPLPLSPLPLSSTPPWLCVCVFLGRLLVTSYEYFAHALPTISHFVRAMTTTTPQPPNPYPSPYPCPVMSLPPPPALVPLSVHRSHVCCLPPASARIQSQLVVMPPQFCHTPLPPTSSPPLPLFCLLLLPLLWFVFLLLLSRFRPTMTHSSSIGLFFTMLPLKPAPPSSLPIPLAIILPLATQPDVVANTISVRDRERKHVKRRARTHYA